MLMAPLVILKNGSPCSSYSRVFIRLYTQRWASVGFGRSWIRSLYVVLIDVLGVVLGMPNCPCCGAVLVDGLDEEEVGGFVSGSESERTCSAFSLSELSGSTSEELLRLAAIPIHSFGCASAERSTQD